jgi:MFS family permease
MGSRRDLFLVAVGSSVSWFGNSLAVIALTLTLRGTGSYAIAGLFIAETVPLLLAASVGGLIADRFPNRRLMIFALIGQAAAAIGLAFCQPSLVPVFGFVVLLSIGGAIVRPASSALLPVITGEDGSNRGFAWMSTASSIGLLLGTAAGGVLATAFGTRTAMLIDAATFGLQTLALLLVRAERRPDLQTERGTAGHEILAGLRLLFGDRLLITAVGGMAASYFAVNLVLVAEVFFITSTLHRSGIVLGLIQGMWMVGALVGARIGVRFQTVRGIALMLAVCECGMGIAMGWPAALPQVIVLSVSYLLGGACNGAQTVGHNAMIRLRTPQAMRGRVFAGSGSLISGANLLANLVGGLVVAATDARFTYALACVLTLAVGVGALLLSLRLTTPSTGTQQQRTARTA